MSFDLPPVRARVLASIVMFLFCGLPSPALAAIRVNELNLGCLDGSRDVAYIEVTATSTDTFDPNVGLEVRGPGNALMADVPHVYGARTGVFATGRSFLVATSAFATRTGFLPDALLPMPPDPAEGRILLYTLAVDGVTRVTLDSLRYGPTTNEPPPPGSSLVWNGSGRQISAAATPETYLDGAVRSSCFGTGSPVTGSATWEFSEMLTSCENGSTATQFFELHSTTAGLRRSQSVLRIYDRQGDLTGTVGNPFGASAGFPTLVDRFAFVATTNYPQRDALLSVGLDPVRGRVEMWDGLYLHFVFRWGSGGVPAPRAGESVEWAAGSYVTPRTPVPRNTGYFVGVPSVPNCYFIPAAGTSIREVMLQCDSGQPAMPFVELGAPVAGVRMGRGVELESRAHDGALLQVVPLDFGTATGGDWPSTTYWLVSGDLYVDGATGGYVMPQTNASPQVDAAGGVLRLQQRPASGPVIPLDSLVYGPGGQPLPPPGFSLYHQGPTTWVPGRATPQRTASTLAYSECMDLCPYATITLDGAPNHNPLGMFWSINGGTRGAYVDPIGGMASAQLQTAGSAEAKWADRFVVAGPAAGTPVPLALRVNAQLHGQPEVCQAGACIQGTASVEADAPGAVHGALAVTASGDSSGVLELRFNVLAGEPFDLAVRCRADLVAGAGGAPSGSFSGSSTGSITVLRFDPAVTVQSCKGLTAIQLGSPVGVPGPSAKGGPTRLAVRQVLPNPTRGLARLALALPRAGAVRADVLDVAGRRVLAREWGELAAGEHTLALAAPGELAPGFYLVRVRQAGESATTRLLVTR